mmetsp:Transcript_27976/g.39401  ORF Transcript_27976/g.39401 Transcript_27976/m.39401 type:complete len:314 (+) Transcript_27976:246-1187(+)
MSAAAAAVASSVGKHKLTISNCISSFRSMRKALDPNMKIGFVPTMGALHDGHLSLLKKARTDNDVVIASIFVNPTQFGVGEDLDKYPRQFEKDTAMLSQLGVDHVFAPNVENMYSKNHMMYIDPTGFDDIPEGTSRPGHFRGVATIVAKLFNIVQPSNAYFGQKDAAQCVLIRRLVEDLNMMDLNVVICDTVREKDGLAMSSRNAYLECDERAAAPIIYQSLCSAKDLYQNSNNSDGSSISSQELVDNVKSVIQSEPLVSEIQYISVDNLQTMKPIQEVNREDGAVISLACKVGKVRLIDNIVLEALPNGLAD